MEVHHDIRQGRQRIPRQGALDDPDQEQAWSDIASIVFILFLRQHISPMVVKAEKIDFRCFV